MNAKPQSYEFVAEPCRNFNILNTATFVDPRDGREKLVLSNFVAGGTGNLIFIDALSGEGESVPLPGDSGAWALLNWNDEKLIVGTCPDFAYVHCYDLAAREWAEPLRFGQETYIWNFTLGSDGMIYGGTYPGCQLLRYDPKRHLLESVGRVSDNEKNLYCRQVRGEAAGYILLAGGFEQPFMKAWHIAERTLSDFGIPGAVFREVNAEFVCLEAEGRLAFFDARTLEPLHDDDGLRQKLAGDAVALPGGKMNRAVRLASGRRAGVRGQEYFVAEEGGGPPELRIIPVPAPPTRIHTLAADAQGNIWGATTFGQTIFRYEPSSGSYWNSPTVCDHGGEVYGMQFVGSRLFMSAYAGGDHIVYDPELPWDQLNNANPKTLRPVGPELIRPTGRTVQGPDDGVWTGWSAKYGTYGGGLSRIDPVTLEVVSWYDPIPDQQVAGLAADHRYLYFTTNGGASGLPYKEEPCHFGVWSPEGRLVYKHRFEPGLRAGAVLALGGRVLVQIGTEIRVFDPESMTFGVRIAADEPCSWMTAVDTEKAAAFCGKKLYWIDAARGDKRFVTELPGAVHAAAVTPGGDLYFASGTRLYRLV